MKKKILFGTILISVILFGGILVAAGRRPREDINRDCVVDELDLEIIGNCYDCERKQDCWKECKKADLNRDRVIDLFDLAAVGLAYGEECANKRGRSKEKLK